jgi:hypothetical protein
MEPDNYSATVVRLRNAVPRNGSVEIAQTLLDRLQLVPPGRRRRNWIPSIVGLRQLRRLRMPAVALRQRKPGTRLGSLELLGLRRLRRRSRR